MLQEVNPAEGQNWPSKRHCLYIRQKVVSPLVNETIQRGNSACSHNWYGNRNYINNYCYDKHLKKIMK